jgi:hypothetical protein
VTGFAKIDMRRQNPVQDDVSQQDHRAPGSLRRTGRFLFALLIGIGITAHFGTPRAAHAEDAEIAKRRKAERTNFTDAEIFEGFFKTAFGAELNFAGRVERIRKYHKPVRVYVENHTNPDRSGQVAAVVADIKAHIANLDIAMTSDRGAATTIVQLLRARDLDPMLRRVYGRERAGKIHNSLDPQCLSGFSKDGEYRIIHSDVYLVADRGDFIFLDCTYEELLQSMGPINDTSSVPWTMFNDHVQMGFFDVYDQYILNIFYHPRVRAGMTRDQVRAILPEIMPEVRAFVGKVNELKP